MKNTIANTAKVKGNVTALAPVFTIVGGETKSLKPLYAIRTAHRLSLDDYKALIRDVTVAGGHFFKKYMPEYEIDGVSNFIAATGINAKTLESLAGQYTWNAPEKKQTAKKPGKAAKETAIPTVDPATLALFQQFMAQFKK